MEFHLLIVDDEAPIRKGLSHFIDWSAIDCIVDDTACDGLEAIEKLSEYSIDIIITDIKMPEADGITLAKYVWEHCPKTLVILLTGYADFKYAQTAIQYNVVEFLLKPTSKDQLINAVQNAQKQIITSKKQNLAKKEELAFLIERVLQELTDSPFHEALSARLKGYGIGLNCYYIAAFQLLPATKDIQTLKNILISQKQESYCYRYNNLVLAVYDQEGGIDPIPLKIQDNCREVTKIVNELTSQEIAIGISRCHQGSGQFSQAASEAISALAMNFYSDKNISLYTGENAVTDYVLTAEDTLNLYRIETALINWNFKEASIQVHSLFSKLTTNFAKSIDIKNICSQIYYIGSRVLMKKELSPPPASLLADISSSSALFQLEDIISGMLKEIERSLINSGKSYSRIIESSIQYIHQNLANPLSLEGIATHIHVNPSYLSRTFKKECGQAITDYINQVRIEKAKELLTSNNTLAYEAAEQVGFHDPAYFSSIFKKYTGYSPKEYKLMHQ